MTKNNTKLIKFINILNYYTFGLESYYYPKTFIFMYPHYIM